MNVEMVTFHGGKAGCRQILPAQKKWALDSF